MRFIEIVSISLVFGLSMGHMPMMCLSDPPVLLQAGVSMVTARIYNPLPRRCLASVAFDNEDFLPVSYAFESGKCDGVQLASFLVPLAAPNGDAYVAWQCAGQSPSCSRVVISGGKGNNSAIEPQRNGTMSCIEQTFKTSTISTTVTGSSTTAVKTFLSVVTSLTTSQLGTSSWVNSTRLPSVLTTSLPIPRTETEPIESPSIVPQTGLETLPAPTAAQTSTAAPATQNVTGGTLGDEPIFTSAGSRSSPPRAAITLLSTITVMQTVTALVSATCSGI
ncbi:hypothetical protein V8F33_001717 [Rhypophila sp. PSN 637]